MSRPARPRSKSPARDAAPSLAIDAWLGEIEAAYRAAAGADHLVKRFAGWRGSGDTAALLYAVLQELRAIRAELAASRSPGQP